MQHSEKRGFRMMNSTDNVTENNNQTMNSTQTEEENKKIDDKDTQYINEFIKGLLLNENTMYSGNWTT